MTASTFVEEPAAAPVILAGPGAPAGWRHELLRYLACSAAALAVDSGLFVALLSAGVPWHVAAALGFCAGLGLAYGLSVRFVFVHRRLSDARGEFALFAAVGLFGLLLTEALLWLLLQRLQLPPLLAKLASAVLVFASNFSLRKLLLFTRRGPAR